jgi:hypothetical protein
MELSRFSQSLELPSGGQIPATNDSAKASSTNNLKKIAMLIFDDDQDRRNDFPCVVR